MINKILGGLVAVVALVGVGFWLDKPADVVNVPVQGALSSPDIQSTWLRVGGVMHEYRYTTFTGASTTPCALQAPSSTSTLVHFGVKLTVATSTATTWTLAKATTAFATTTAFDQFSVGSGALGTFYVGHASTTAPDEAGVIAPTNYLVAGVAGTAIGNSALMNGVCQAEFLVY